VARRVTRVSRGLRLPKVQEPVLPPPSVRDQVVGMLQWPGGIQLDPGLVQEPPPGTSIDALELEGDLSGAPFRRQEIAVRRNGRGRKRR
jgi:hypothetical protein